MADAVTDAWSFLDGKVSVPSEMRTAEWVRVPQWLRERSYYMAGVHRAEVLEEFRGEVAEIAAGRRGIEESRKRLEQFLDATGYTPEPGQEGTIKDLRSARRMLVSLRTNVALLQGYGQKERGMRPGALRATPAWELVRVEERNVPRDWADRFEQVGGKLSEGGRIIALKTSDLWRKLGTDFEDSIGVDYVPLWWGSGGGWRGVGFREAKELGLLDGWTPPAPRPVASPNEALQTKPRIEDELIKEALADHLQGLAEWKGDTLVFTDPNGSRPTTAAELAKVWERGMPAELAAGEDEGLFQREALRIWAEDPEAYERDDLAKPPPGRLDRHDDLTRLFRRLATVEPGTEVTREISFLDRKAANDFARRLADAGGREVSAAVPGEAWSRVAGRAIAGAGRWVVRLVCKVHRSAKDLAALVEGLSKMSPAAGDTVFLSGTRFKVSRADGMIIHLEEI